MKIICFIVILIEITKEVTAIEEECIACYDCKSGATCKSIEEMQDKTPCLPGWLNCQTVTIKKKGKVVSVRGGCVSGPKTDKDWDCSELASAYICICSTHLCNGVDLGTSTLTQKCNLTTQKTTPTTHKATPTQQKTAPTTQKTATMTQKTTPMEQKTTPTTHRATPTTQKTAPTTQKTDTTTQKTNGIEILEVATLETLVLISFVSFVLY